MEGAYFTRLKFRGLAEKSYAKELNFGKKFYSNIQQNNNGSKLTSCSFARKYNVMMYNGVQNLR